MKRKREGERNWERGYTRILCVKNNKISGATQVLRHKGTYSVFFFNKINLACIFLHNKFSASLIYDKRTNSSLF